MGEHIQVLEKPSEAHIKVKHADELSKLALQDFEPPSKPPEGRLIGGKFEPESYRHLQRTDIIDPHDN